MIFYFSGTGNSEYLAKRLGEIIDDEVINLFDYIKNNENKTFNSERPFVLVAPTYSWRVPRFLTDYLKKCKFTGNKNMYVIMNFGDSCGDADKYIREDVKSLGLNYKGLYGIKMPENYLALFELDSDEKNREIVKEADIYIEKAAKIIKEGKDFEKKEIKFQDKIISGLVNDLFFKFIVKDKKFYYTDKCIECGKCEKECVLNNISYEDGKPKWNGNCTHCMACLSKCPTGAIEYGKKTVGKERYLLGNIVGDGRK